MGLFSFLKKKKTDDEARENNADVEENLDNKLTRTRGRFKDSLLSFVLGSGKIDDDLLEELEGQLITADLGVAVTERVIEAIKTRLSRTEANDADACLLYTSPSPRDGLLSRMPSSA